MTLSLNNLKGEKFMESNYTKQEWKDYDESKDFQTNVGEGGVATAEKMDHIEQGIYDANIPYTVGSVTTGAEASVVINPDKSIDFVIPSNGSTEKSFGVSTSAPIEGIISKDTVVGENPGFILGPDGTVYEVKGTDVDGNYVVEASQSIQIKGEKGDPGEQGPQGEKGETGEQGPAGQDGAAGLSAYDIWKAQPGNESKSEEEFLASLKGEKGDQGEQGPQGEQGIQGPAGADGAPGAQGEKGETGEQGTQGIQGPAGQSAYELWKTQPGNESKSEEEFLASLKGEKGDKGDPGEGGSGDMAIGHGKLTNCEVLNEDTSDVKLSIKYTDPEPEGVPFGGTVIAVKEDTPPEGPEDCDFSNDCMEKDKYKTIPLEIPIPNTGDTNRKFFVRMFPYSASKVFNLLGRETKEISAKFKDITRILSKISEPQKITGDDMYISTYSYSFVYTPNAFFYYRYGKIYKVTNDNALSEFLDINAKLQELKSVTFTDHMDSYGTPSILLYEKDGYLYTCSVNEIGDSGKYTIYALKIDENTGDTQIIGEVSNLSVEGSSQHRLSIIPFGNTIFIYLYNTRTTYKSFLFKLDLTENTFENQSSNSEAKRNPLLLVDIDDNNKYSIEMDGVYKLTYSSDTKLVSSTSIIDSATVPYNYSSNTMPIDYMIEESTGKILCYCGFNCTEIDVDNASYETFNITPTDALDADASMSLNDILSVKCEDDGTLEYIYIGELFTEDDTAKYRCKFKRNKDLN